MQNFRITPTARRVIKYIISGGTGAVVNLGLYAFFIYIAHMWYVHASVIGFCVGVSISFLLQKFWTFDTKDVRTLGNEAIMYFSIAIINACINGFILSVLVEKVFLGKLSANIVSNVCIALWSYVLYTRVVFAPRPPRVSPPNLIK